jgi:hypothetical protein
MTLTDARELLDAVRGGMDATRSEIQAALGETGDIDADEIVREQRPVGSWERVLPSQLRPADPFDGLCRRHLEEKK